MFDWRPFSVALLLLGLAQMPASACESFVSLDTEQIKTLRQTLSEPKSNVIDRAIAFETLVCDSRQYVREDAMRSGLQAGQNDPTLRSAVLAQILFNAGVVRIELVPNERLNREAQNFVKQTGGLLTLEVHQVIRPEACLVLASGRRETCGAGLPSIRISGTKVSVRWNRGDGLFELKGGSVLIGYFRPQPNASPIPGKINLL